MFNSEPRLTLNWVTLLSIALLRMNVDVACKMFRDLLQFSLCRLPHVKSAVGRVRLGQVKLRALIIFLCVTTTAALCQYFNGAVSVPDRTEPELKNTIWANNCKTLLYQLDSYNCEFKGPNCINTQLFTRPICACAGRSQSRSTSLSMCVVCSFGGVG